MLISSLETETRINRKDGIIAKIKLLKSNNYLGLLYFTYNNKFCFFNQVIFLIYPMYTRKFYTFPLLYAVIIGERLIILKLE